MSGSIRALAACIGLLGISALQVGCSREENSPEAKIAAEALGVDPAAQEKKTTEKKRDVDVVQETKVVDRATGEILSDQTKTTPVTISQEKKVRSDVDVKVGDSQVTEPR